MKNIYTLYIYLHSVTLRSVVMHRRTRLESMLYLPDNHENHHHAHLFSTPTPIKDSDEQSAMLIGFNSSWVQRWVYRFSISMH